MNQKPVHWAARCRRKTLGVTLIELMIVVAFVSVVLTLELPVYSNFGIRDKVANGLSAAVITKMAPTDACQKGVQIPSLSRIEAGHSGGGLTYIEPIEDSGTCVMTVTTIQTRKTGATVSPVLVLTSHATSWDSFSWICSTMLGWNIYVSSKCRS